MSTILGLFFFVIIIVLLVGLSLVSSILRLLFGFGRKTNKTNSNNHNTNERTKENTSFNEQKSQTGNRKKIFDDDEGEYVDFEEIKEEK